MAEEKTVEKDVWYRESPLPELSYSKIYKAEEFLSDLHGHFYVIKENSIGELYAYVIGKGADPYCILLERKIMPMVKYIEHTVLYKKVPCNNRQLEKINTFIGFMESDIPNYAFAHDGKWYSCAMKDTRPLCYRIVKISAEKYTNIMKDKISTDQNTKTPNNQRKNIVAKRNKNINNAIKNTMKDRKNSKTIVPYKRDPLWWYAYDTDGRLKRFEDGAWIIVSEEVQKRVETKLTELKDLTKNYAFAIADLDRDPINHTKIPEALRGGKQRGGKRRHIRKTVKK